MAAIEYLNGLQVGEVVECTEQPLLIGRAEECQVVLDSQSVSRSHCQIFDQSGAYYLRDMGSRNKTILNGRKILVDELLVDGDEITVSGNVFRFLSQDSLMQESGTWGNRPKLISIETADDEHEAEEEKSLTRQLVEAGQKLSNSKLGGGHLNLGRVVVKLQVGDGSGGWPVVQDAPVKLNQLMQFLYEIRRKATIDEILGRSFKFLFEVFPVTQNIAMVFRSKDADGIRVEAVASRDPSEEVQICIPVVRHAMQYREALLYADHWSSTDTDKMQPQDSTGTLKSIMCCPLSSSSSFCLGAIQMDGRAEEKSFEAADLERFAILAQAMSVLIEQAQECEFRRRRLMDWNEAGGCGQPAAESGTSSLTAVPGFQAMNAMIAEKTACRDLVSIFQRADQRLGVVMVNCPTNHPSKEVVAANFLQSLKELLCESAKPDSWIVELLRLKQEEAEDAGFDSCCMIVNSKGSNLIYLASGGFQVFLIRQGEVHILTPGEEGDSPIKMNSQNDSHQEFRFQQNDLLAAFSDGILAIRESEGSADHQTLSLHAFQQQLQALAQESLDTFPVAVYDRLKEYRARELLQDDIAFTMLARTNKLLVADEDRARLIESGTTTS